jgi:hypothetical protein
MFFSCLFASFNVIGENSLNEKGKLFLNINCPIQMESNGLRLNQNL